VSLAESNWRSIARRKIATESFFEKSAQRKAEQCVMDPHDAKERTRCSVMIYSVPGCLNASTSIRYAKDMISECLRSMHREAPSQDPTGPLDSITLSHISFGTFLVLLHSIIMTSRPAELTIEFSAPRNCGMPHCYLAQRTG
jgi:hypothetical protein